MLKKLLQLKRLLLKLLQHQKLQPLKLQLKPLRLKHLLLNLLQRQKRLLLKLSN
jgi:hypothetical protein